MTALLLITPIAVGIVGYLVGHEVGYRAARRVGLRLGYERGWRDGHVGTRRRIRIHLKTEAGVLCRHPSPHVSTSTDPSDVTCKRCSERIMARELGALRARELAAREPSDV